MRLTRETEYALLGLSALARRHAPVPLIELARAEGLPASFLAKIFQKLTRHGVLLAARGPGHGYALASAPEAVSVLDIIEVVQGPEYLNRCVFWAGRCGGRKTCLLHERWLTIKPQVLDLLRGTTLADLAWRAAAPA